MQLSEIDTYKSTLNKFTDTVQYTTMCVQLSSHLSQACMCYSCVQAKCATCTLGKYESLSFWCVLTKTKTSLQH